MEFYEISDHEFNQFQGLIHQLAGVHLPESKKAMVCSRLTKRLRARCLASFGDYFRLLTSGEDNEELKEAIDLLTTHETYFFRETAHFDYLRGALPRLCQKGRPLRVWSAASSTGEEAYSLAMLLDDVVGARQWDVIGTDISSRVIDTARTGLYPMERSKSIPGHYLKRYCLRGVGAREGCFIVDPVLRKRVNFSTANLCEPHPELGTFDVVFLRNVLIYFNQETKRQVAWCQVRQLRTGGIFVIGHAESLNGATEELGLEMLMPSIYRKVAEP